VEQNRGSKEMDDRSPLYNSRIMKIYVEYLHRYYPDLDVDAILEYAGMTNYEVEDPAHWFNQDQADHFYEVLIEKTGNANISRDAGRYATSSSGLGPAKQYTLGLISPTALYLLMGKMYTVLSRGAEIKTRKIGTDKIEIICTPKPGVNEKLYQCENRIGIFESLAKLFTNSFARIEHLSCFHKGDECCRYIVSWERTPSLVWKRIRNYFVLAGLLLCVPLFFFLAVMHWVVLLSFLALVYVLLSMRALRLQNKQLTRTIETQGDAAKAHLDEINIRYHNALLVQEIGQATSTILDSDELMKTVVRVMERHLDFDRGAIFMANAEKTLLHFITSYGFNKEQEALLRQTEFRLDNPDSRGIFVLAFRDQKPLLLSDISHVEGTLSKRSLELARQMGVQSLICVPIICENESLGILVVDKVKQDRSLTQSDLSLLMGVASQTAVSIFNARSFQKLQDSEQKYRELVENANSIILRMSIEGKITFFNEFAQKFFGYTEEDIYGKDVIGTLLPGTKDASHGLEKLVVALQKDPERQVVSENENILRSGERVYIAWTYKPIYDGSRQFQEILCIGNDVTGLKRAEKEKKELEARLQRAQKMEAIGTLAGGVAHDLNNILTGLVSYPDLLLLQIPQESPLRQPVLTIQKSGERAAAIVQDLLTLARRGSQSESNYL
jgi:PAS domain S-box-containing protein